MARAYSNDLRERAATLVSTGRSCREVASLFGVSVASVVKWSQRQRATGTAAARPMGGHRKRVLEPHRDMVIARLKAMPDLTIKALVAELAEQGITTSPVTVWRLVRSAGLRFKKKRCSPSSRSARPWHEGVRSGRNIRGGLILGAWCSSTKPGRRRT